MDAIVTAGGRITGRFAQKAGTSIKALINLGGKTVIEILLSALRKTPDISKIIVIGPISELEASGACTLADKIVPEGENGAENFLIGLKICAQADRVLFAASDMPFIYSDVINHFIAMCPDTADLCYPIINAGVFAETYPKHNVRSVKLKNGDFIGGCIFLINPKVLLANQDIVENVFRSRKSIIKLAGLLGVRFLLGIITHNISIEDCERRASSIFACTCKAVIERHPEIAFDLDKPQDYEYAIARLIEQTK